MAEGKLLLEIVTPQGLVFSEEVDEVTATGTEENSVSFRGMYLCNHIEDRYVVLQDR
jgi:hypothetical protein